MGRNLSYIFCFFAVIFCHYLSHCQSLEAKGQILSVDKEPIVKAKVFVKNTSLQTTTDSLGLFHLKNLPEKGVIQVQSKDYLTRQYDYNNKSQKDSILQVNLSLDTQKRGLFNFKNPDNEYALFLLDLVAKNNPPTKYQVEYYSKGSIQLANERQTFLGQQRKDLDIRLDLSLPNAYLYTGEYLSDITVLNQNYVHELVKAVRETGNNKDIFLQTGIDSHLDFYTSKVSNHLKLISPLAPYARNYYDFELINILTNDQGHNIYTISFTPKREREPVLAGEMTITDHMWQLTSIYAFAKGTNIGIPSLKTLAISQYFDFDHNLNRYIKKQQNLYINGEFIVFNFTGQFHSYYSNYKRDHLLSKKDFSNELISYSQDYDTQSEQYWNANRPYQLSNNEINNFTANKVLDKDQTIHMLDSIDRRNNNMTLFKFVKGYRYINSNKNTAYSYRGLLSTFAFNAVQGFNVTTGLDFVKRYPNGTQTNAGAILNYGVSENKTRFSGYASHLLNEINYNKITLSGGSSISQFNWDEPIKTPINSFASAWFGKNYAKYFQRDFIKLQYEQYVFTGLKFKGYLEYANRRTLTNHIKTPPFVPHLSFESNNPLDPTDFDTQPFINNKAFVLDLQLDLVFDQKTISYPERNFYLPMSSFPVISLNVRKALNSTTSDYNYTFFSLSTTFNNNINIYGDLFIGLSIGRYLEQNPISFTDYKHFNGNQTFIGSVPVYNKQFNLLPYYSYSTNISYVEFHMEHDFRGYLINKIPLLNKTGFSFVVGFHLLEVPEKDVYQEFSVGLNNIGIGKFRPFRIDYFTSISPDAPKKYGFVLGIKILDMIQK